MRQPGADRRRALASILAGLALIAAALAVWAQATGGFRTYVFGVPLSVRGTLRPTLAALAFGAAALHLVGAWRWRVWHVAAHRLAFAPPIIAAAASLGMLVAGLLYGAKATGGSDPYGYVSQAMLWLRGDLHIRQDFVASVPWPNAAWTFSPLGYRPAEGFTIVPTYAPGTALLMALGHAIVGACGPYVVGPLCGAALVWLSYRLGVRLSGPIAGLIAACCIAASPTVLLMANWPMSDVPAATFWTASLVAALRSGRAGALTSGVMAGIAITIRPNIAPLTLAPAALVYLSNRADVKTSASHVTAFAIGCAPFVLFVAWLFNSLYGSPLRSGYGDLGELYALSHAAENLKLYPSWFVDSQGPLAFAWLAAPAVAVWRRGPRLPFRLVLFAFAGLVFFAYLFYLPFETWTYLRFLLPAYPVIFVLAADVFWEASAVLGRWGRGAVMLLIGTAMVGVSATQSDGRNVLEIGSGEQKFADVGRYVASSLPRNALVLAMQHGGNVRYYSGRLTMRYDQLDSAWLDRALAHLRTGGHEPFLVLEDWEVQRFREQFAGQRGVAAVDRLPVAVTLDGIVRVYRADPDAAAGTTGSAIIAKTSGCVRAHPSQR